jgi:1-acyl-sn-glycerol-3-phosphate acyltransferase
MRQLRSVLFTVWFYAVTLSMAAFGQIVVLLWPGQLRTYARRWGSLVLSALPICGIRYKIIGQENLPKDGPMLIASMHQSAFDTLLWFGMVPYCRYVVKIELTRLPLFGRLVRMSGSIGVDRAGGGATMRLLLREGGAALAAGCQIVIFPEGTRVTAGEIAPLQPGVAALAKVGNVRVIPVATDSGHCWGKGSFGKRPGVIHVLIRPPIEAGLSREALMIRLREEFEAGAAELRALAEPVDNSVH